MAHVVVAQLVARSAQRQRELLPKVYEIWQLGGKQEANQLQVTQEIDLAAVPGLQV